MFHQFYQKTPKERRVILKANHYPDLDKLAGPYDEALEALDLMSENVIGSTKLPLGLLTGIRVNDKEYPVVMATEEPSVVAAANRSARVLNASGGVSVKVKPSTTMAQILLLVVPEARQVVQEDIESSSADYLVIANMANPQLIEAGGGAFFLDAEIYQDARVHLSDGRPADLVVVRLWVRSVDAMGANAVNSMAEPVLKAMAQKHFGYSEPGMAILSNSGIGRQIYAQVTIPYDVLSEYARRDGRWLANRIEMASFFAEDSPERAVTHNKGILNGIIAAAIPLGQDTRAISASAYDWACKGKIHQPLSKWRAIDSGLQGTLEMPMFVGFKGGFRKHPAFDAAFEFSKIDSYESLCSVLAAVGIAQNLGALWALVTDGIQAGHMALHKRKDALRDG